MDREQVKAIVRKINVVYQVSIKDDLTFVIDTWHGVLKDYEFSYISNNLDNYIKAGNEFAPKAAQLIKPTKTVRYIPSVEETKKYLEEQEALKAKVKDDPKVKKAKEEARNKINALFGR